MDIGDDNQDLPSQFGVKSIPTLMFFEGGEMVERVTEATSQAVIEGVVDKVLSGDKLITPLVVR